MTACAQTGKQKVSNNLAICSRLGEVKFDEPEKVDRKAKERTRLNNIAIEEDCP